MTAVLGREATLSGQEITWDQAMQSTSYLGPTDHTLGPHEIPAIPRLGTYQFS